MGKRNTNISYTSKTIIHSKYLCGGRCHINTYADFTSIYRNKKKTQVSYFHFAYIRLKILHSLLYFQYKHSNKQCKILGVHKNYINQNPIVTILPENKSHFWQ